jgi:hypothetical protein
MWSINPIIQNPVDSHSYTSQYSKLQLSLYLNKHDAIKVYEGVDAEIHAFLTLELDQG